jgi:predicted SpoU family rRNA methylase
MNEMNCDREHAIAVANEQDKSIKDNIDRIVARFGGTREQALIAAFEALDKQL